MSGDATIVSLSTPRLAATPRIVPSTRPGLPAAGTVGAHALSISAAWSSNRSTSSPMTAAGTRPKFDSAEYRPPMLFTPGVDVPESLGPRVLLEARSRIGDRDEPARGLVGADRLLHAIEEVRLEDVGLERRARLARDDEQRSREVERCLDRANLRRIGRVEDVKRGRAGNRSERLHPHFRAQARAAHAEQQRVCEAVAAHFRLHAPQRRQIAELVVDDADPANPARFVAACPERRVARE